MKENRVTKLYNVLFPSWMLMWYPRLFVILIPANYLMDTFVLSFSLMDESLRKPFRRKHTWKICLAGFLSDFAGALILLIISIPLADLNEKLYDIGHAIMLDPFSNPAGLLIVVASIAVSAVCIYSLDKWILGRAGLDPEQVKRSALRLALITAPYLYLFPSRLLYK